MAAGGIVLLAFSWLAGDAWIIPSGVETWLAMAYLVVLGSVALFALHWRASNEPGAGRFAVLHLSAWLLWFTVATGCLGLLLLHHLSGPDFAVSSARLTFPPSCR